MEDLYTSTCLSTCNPYLIISLDPAVNDITKVAIYDDCCNLYCDDTTLYAYSLDGACWSNYGTRQEIDAITSGLDSDFFVKAKINGPISNVQYANEDVPYSTAIDSGFNFGSICGTNGNIYSPYSNMENAIALLQLMVDYASCVVGIPIYYFRVTPVQSSKDLTFKEYCLLNVSEVKQIKLIIQDGLMPSSKPEFSEFGIDFLTDWETYISKSVFATAFGNTAKPMEHDFIYIPMQDRMWMVNSAYEEKKDAFMWCSTYFTVALVKYQEKESIDLGDQEEFVAELVTAKYEELFGENENLGSGEEHTTEAPRYVATNLYPIFESDAVRKEASMDTIDFSKQDIFQRSMKLSDNLYQFSLAEASIVYQKQFCGNEGSCSFIIQPRMFENSSNNIINIGNISLRLDYTTLVLENNEDIKVELENETTFFVYLRWSQKLNIIEFIAARYTHLDMPIYRLKPFHYYFDMDNLYSKCLHKYDIEMTQDSKGDVIINNFNGLFTNFKLFDKYIDDVAELMQQYPTHSNLLINDTARKFVDLNGNRL